MAFIKREKKVVHKHTQYENLNTPDDVIKLALSREVETEPLDIAELVKVLGIKINFEPMKDDESGSLIKHKKTGDWHIKVNSLHHPHRQRFTIAHEIGHHIKHGAFADEFIDTTFFRNNESNRQEAEANAFAAELLMPKDKFNAFIEAGNTQVEDISKHFQVSSMAVRIRAKQLGYKGHNL